MNKTNDNYRPVIGLEIHIELSTKSKMFCGCPSDHFAKKPNTQTCPVCLGLPGALPVPNKKAIESCILLGLALKCKINNFSNFDRKHYFYPDLPKGYQITQYEDPFCFDGQWTSKTGQTIRIRRIHMEEDTAKLQHTVINGKKVTLIDFNRSGVPLVELVTEPDFRDTETVIEFTKELQKIIRFLEISIADMEKGTMRLEANVSLTRAGEWKSGRVEEKDLPNYKVELKNINSFRFLKNAINYEIERQKDILENNGKIVQETRGWNESLSATYSQRLKEEAKDYRYFPDPDIPPVRYLNSEIDILMNAIPELPDDIRKRYIKTLSLSDSFAEILSSDKKRAKYFDETVILSKKHNIGVKTIADLIVNKNYDILYPEPQLLIRELLKLLNKDSVSYEDTKRFVTQVLSENKKAVDDFQNGKGTVLGFLIGQTQKKLNGNGNPEMIKKVIIECIHENCA